MGQYSYNPSIGRLEDAGNLSFDYDANGNVVARWKITAGFPPPPTEFAYNAQDKLRSILSSSDMVELEYDADGNRVLRRSAAEDTKTYYIGDLMEEIWEDGANRPSRRYKVHADGRVVVQVVEAPATSSPSRTRYFLHHDHLGSPTLVTDSSGADVQRMHYDMWGAKRGNNWTSPAPYQNLLGISVGYTGHEEQIDGGLMNMRGRMYDPKIGRFMSGDPIVAQPETLQGWNRYAYVENNPLKFVDPTGHQQRNPGEGAATDPDQLGGMPRVGTCEVSGGRAVCTPGGSVGPGAGPTAMDYGPFANFVDWVEGLGEQQGAAPVNQTSNATNTASSWIGGVADGAVGLAQDAIDLVAPDELDVALLASGSGIAGATFALGVATGGTAAAVIGVAYVGQKVLRSRVGRKLLEAGACFGEGTPVVAEEGLVPIEEVEVGDLVWARDVETGEEGWRRVLEVFVTPDQELLELTFESEDGASAVLRVTPDHPLWSLTDGTWENAGDLELGEQVDALEGSMRLVAAVAPVEVETVYNFEVEDSHTYFVSEAGVWAHNDCVREALRGLLSGTSAAGKTAAGTVVRQAQGGLPKAQARFGDFIGSTGARVITKAAGRGAGIGSGGGSVQIATIGATRVILRESSTHAGAATIEIRAAGNAVRKIRFFD